MSVSNKWRLRSLWHQTGNGTGQIGIGKLSWASVAGGATLCVGGTASASSTYGGFYDPARTFDLAAPVANGLWYGPAGLNAWIEYDFPAPVSIVECRMIIADPNDSPRAFVMEYFDGAVWQIEFLGYNDSAWTVGPTYTFTEPTRQNSNQYWGFVSTAGINPGWFDVFLAHCAMHIVPAGADVCGTGIPHAKPAESGGNPIANAFAPNSGGFYNNTTGTSGTVIFYDFGAGNNKIIVEMVFTADAAGNHDRAPGTGYFIYSQDGNGFGLINAFNGLIYAANQVTVPVALPLAPSDLVLGQLVMITVTNEIFLPEMFVPLGLGQYLATYPYYVGE